MIEERREVIVYNVHAKCECGGLFTPASDFIQWDNKNSISLSDDEFKYKYLCNSCNEELIINKKYPYQEFIEV
jgi:hypothetical protein